MPGMTKHRTTERHAATPRQDHLWVLFVIAACVLAEVWASWVGIGSISGFPKIGHIPTDWVLAMAMEAYWGYALYAWLVASPGPRSRSMAMWSCGVVFVLSLTGQVLYHEITAPAGTPIGKRIVIGFVTSLPVIVLALIAVLIHMRHIDRAEMTEAAEEAALDTELADASAALRQAEADRDTARDEAAQATQAMAVLQEQMAALEAKLEAALKGDTAKRQPPRRSAAPKPPARTGGETEEEKLGTEVAALAIIAEEPDISGSELGRRLGTTPGYGRTLMRKLVSASAGGDS